MTDLLSNPPSSCRATETIQIPTLEFVLAALPTSHCPYAAGCGPQFSCRHTTRRLEAVVRRGFEKWPEVHLLLHCFLNALNAHPPVDGPKSDVRALPTMKRLALRSACRPCWYPATEFHVALTLRTKLDADKQSLHALLAPVESLTRLLRSLQRTFGPSRWPHRPPLYHSVRSPGFTLPHRVTWNLTHRPFSTVSDPAKYMSLARSTLSPTGQVDFT